MHRVRKHRSSSRGKKPMDSKETVTIPALQQMKRDGKKIVGVVAWDYQIAQIVDRAGVDMIKLDGAADFPEAVRALSRAGIPVFAQFGITPQTALAYGIPYSAMN